MKPHRGFDVLIGIAVLALPISASADYFSLYVKCDGEVSSPKGRAPANLDLALRDNNQTALIQRSNVLPVGDKMKYEVSPAAYSMTYRSPQARTQLYYDWYRGALFAWDPSLKRLAYIRVSIDRQTGNLEGDYRNADDTILATFRMRCEKADPNSLPPPKF
ncbi:MAG TPA: hypothetical protein VMK32_13430 [Burkholderiaceae bacterium]|nr:hypothetical protein [Burkholderiaceae bacterium]